MTSRGTLPTINVVAGDASALDAPVLAIVMAKPAALDASLAALDEATGGALARTIARGDFTGRRDEVLHLAGGTRGPARILLVGAGDAPDRAVALKRAGALAARRASALDAGAVAVVVVPGAEGTALEALVTGLTMGAWEYRDLKSPPKEPRSPVTSITVVVGDAARDEGAVRAGESVGAGYALARRLQMMPGNLCTPDFLADTARDIAARHALEVTVLGRREMESLRMGSFLAVAQGTPQEPRLVALEYRGGGDARPLVLVGKGICFDTGGISIKPAERMEWMKYDMSGAAGVLGAMEAIARLRLKVNVVGLVGATTNMPSGTAINPGDVVQASNGTFIEIVNTDAEGRLVLADVLAYAKKYDPAAVVDAATLTGAVVIGLGNSLHGVMGNDPALVQELLGAGTRAGEPGWELPLWPDYEEQIKSDTADIKNTGGRAAGTITAGLFLKVFAEGYPWVHLDVAGTAYSESDLVALPRGGTGRPVGTFVEFVRARAR
ncbi:MAG: leucyl aminopeptidase [Gemmatimonadaceae bacterium]|nr:leucyl aminopeptidase [Gemmatimonadaceae bacterium]